jgi:hypothetical protein
MNTTLGGNPSAHDVWAANIAAKKAQIAANQRLHIAVRNCEHAAAKSVELEAASALAEAEYKKASAAFSQLLEAAYAADDVVATSNDCFIDPEDIAILAGEVGHDIVAEAKGSNPDRHDLWDGDIAARRAEIAAYKRWMDLSRHCKLTTSKATTFKSISSARAVTKTS